MPRLLAVLLTVLAAVTVGLAARQEVISAPYSQVVDNTTKERFAASESWKRSDSGVGIHDRNYRFAMPAEVSALAMFKVRIPTTAEYAVYARWPRVPGLNDSVPIGVETTSGLEWERVNQRENGGRWVRVGVFRMKAGDDYSVRVSRRTNGRGNVAADAVKVVKVPSGGPTSGPGGSTDNGSGSAEPAGEEVIAAAKTYTGVPYSLGSCSRGAGVDCSCLTALAYREVGVSLPDDPVSQYRYGTQVSGSPRAGDLVFFDENGQGISHVGIATGNGTVVHASKYWGEVTETQMRYLSGYVGARRLL